MSISDKKKFISKGKNIARNGLAASVSVFVLSFLAGLVVTNGTAMSLLGDLSVFSVLFFTLSVVSLALLQMESSEMDYV